MNLDDSQYVVDNPEVRRPSWTGVRRFFVEVRHPSTVAGYYQPLTMVSLMLDTWISRGDVANPFVYRATNVFFHSLNAVLVFAIMRTIFGGLAVPLIVSVFFAVHPVQVESVAWISQRKTVLASFFALAAVLTYLHYGKIERYRFLGAVFFLIMLGNLAKPTLMLLPLTLILLDIWPLNRPVIRRLPEKVPFLILMLAAAYVAWVSQASAGLGAPAFSFEHLPKWAGLLSYNLMLYFGNIFWPMHLSPYRSLPSELSLGNHEILLSMVGAAAFSLSVIVSWKWSKPFLIGSMSFIVILLPALGVVQFASSCVADRFLYLPLFFLLIPLAAAIQHLSHRFPKQAMTVQVCCALFAIPLLVLNLAQQPVWQNSRNLWFHVQSAVPDLPKANYNAALFLYDDRNFEACRDAAAKAVEKDPNASYQYLLGTALTHTGQPEQAFETIKQALRMGLGPRQDEAQIALAEALVAMGDVERARQAMKKASALGVDSARNFVRISRVALEQAHNCELAIEYYRKALDRDSEMLDVRYEFANVLRACNRPTEALAEYEEYIRRARNIGIDVSQLEKAAERFRRTIQETEHPPNGHVEKRTQP